MHADAKLVPEARSAPEETRRRILEATRELYVRYGSRGTTTREVALRAGVNEATIFRHFRTKHALLDAMREHFCEAQKLRSVVAGFSGNLETDLLSLGIALAERLASLEDLIRVSMGEERTDPSGGEVTYRGYSQIREIVNDYLRSQVEMNRLTGDPEVIGRFYSGTLFAHVILRKMYPEGRPPLPQIVTECNAIFLNGVRMQQPIKEQA
jgi:AcrR family transcriptional regulator